MNKTLLPLILLCFISLTCFSQELKLWKGDEEKTFKTGTLFEIVVDNANKSADKRWCSSAELVGKIVSVTDDSLKLLLNSYKIRNNMENVKKEENFYSQTGTIEAKIAKNEIVYLRNYKSLKHKKRKENIMGTGVLMVFTGVVTALNALVVKDKSSKKSILISGGIQLGIGIGFIIAGDTKSYHLRDRGDIWSIKN